MNQGILYIALHNNLIKKYGVNHFTTRREIFAKMGRHNHIPKSVRFLALKELEKKGLIRIENKDRIWILPCEIDLENEPGKLYEIAGIYDTKE